MRNQYFPYYIIVILATLSSCYYLQGHRVSREDFKDCSKIDKELLFLDTIKKRIESVKVICDLCKTPVENPITGVIEYIKLEGTCSCKEYIEINRADSLNH